MIRGVIQYRGWRSLKPNGFKEHLKESLLELIAEWHAKTLPGHFTPSAVAVYKYQPRTKRYMIRKAKKYHHRNPLEFSGTAKRAALSSVKLSGTSKRARGVLPVPSYIYKFHKGNQPDKAAEMTATTQQEAENFAKALDVKLGKRIDLDRSSETVRI